MKKAKVFIVDDDKMFTEMLADHLEAQGLYQTHQFASGSEAIAQMDDEPDFVLLDFYLDSEHVNEPNGLEVLKAMHKKHPHSKIIMLSAQEHYGIAAQTIQSGALHYVIKDETAFEEIDNVLKGMLGN
jgi:two-component system capsular synthesis response regulator RcsB